MGLRRDQFILPDLRAAECKGSVQDFFRNENPDSPKYENHAAFERRARRDLLPYCGRCVVRVACLQFALDHAEIDGVWGGVLPGERQTLRLFRSREGSVG